MEENNIEKENNPAGNNPDIPVAPTPEEYEAARRLNEKPENRRLKVFIVTFVTLLITVLFIAGIIYLAKAFKDNGKDTETEASVFTTVDTRDKQRKNY